MKPAFTLLFIICLINISFSQSLPIFLDGKTEDWNIPLPTCIDDTTDGNKFDFRYFSVTNDEEFLFIRLYLTPEMKLVENNAISLYIDGDNNLATGFTANGIGAELRLDLGMRSGQFYKGGITNIGFPDIQYRSLPTVTDTTYEIAIGRNVMPNGPDLLFTSPTIKIFFRDNDTNGDWMPNNGEVFEYSFDETPTPPVELIDLNKENPNYLRVMNYNVLFDGLTDPTRQQYFTRILQAVQPDIIGFNELWNSTASQVQTLLDNILPIQNGGSWHTVKLDNGNVTASKYPIVQSWLVLSGSRITASLIDLPEEFEKNIMVINAHYRCCDADLIRQQEADATVAFILDAKSPGGRIVLPENTPFVLIGDLNLVGFRQQLTTLVRGEIVNTQLFGNGAAPDWDESDLEDNIAQQTDKRTAYTWRNDNESWPPGRLDFQIYSNSVMNMKKAFVIQTEVMSPARLAQFGLQQFDTRNASDHLPKVTDFSINISTDVTDIHNPVDFSLEQNYPNPFNPNTKFKFSVPSITLRQPQSDVFVVLKVYDVLGNEVATLVNEEKPAGNYEVEFDATNLTSGIYFYQLRAVNFIETKKMTLLK
jgi:endonuclease/exonuclease/phosphatase family metal-dependent hydrolase